MKKNFDADDVKRLYSAFIELCDYIELNDGCGKCPLWDNMCGAKDKTNVDEFSASLARIRDIADIPKP